MICGKDSCYYSSEDPNGAGLSGHGIGAIGQTWAGDCGERSYVSREITIRLMLDI